MVFLALNSIAIHIDASVDQLFQQNQIILEKNCWIGYIFWQTLQILHMANAFYTLK